MQLGGRLVYGQLEILSFLLAHYLVAIMLTHIEGVRGGWVKF